MVTKRSNQRVVRVPSPGRWMAGVAAFFLAAAAIPLSAPAGTVEISFNWTGTTTNSNFPTLPGENATGTVLIQYASPQSTVQIADVLGLQITVHTPPINGNEIGSTFVYGPGDLTQFEVVFNGPGLPASMLIETIMREPSQGDASPVPLRVRCVLQPGQPAGELRLEVVNALDVGVPEFVGPFTPTVAGPGACCNPSTGACIITQESDCPPTVGLQFRGGGVPCSPESCDDRSLPLDFAAPFIPAATEGENCSQLQVADVNRDGLPDVVAYRRDVVNPMACFPGLPGGQLGPAIVVPASAPRQEEAFLLSDFNLDGKADLAFVVESGVAINFGNGDGTFGPDVIVHQVSGARLLTVGRSNADDRPDMVYSRPFASIQAPVFLANPAQGNVWTAQTFPFPPSFENRAIVSGVAADFDADGFDDFYFGRATGQDVLVVSQGTALASGGAAFPREGSPMPGVVASDFNIDGYPDIVRGGFAGQGAGGQESEGAQVQLSAPEPPYVLATSLVLEGAGSAVTRPLCADFNGDGLPDIANVSGNTPVIWTQRRRGDGTFLPNQVFSFPTWTDPIASTAVADMNADGRPDIVAGNSEGISIIINTTGSAGVAAHPQSLSVRPGDAATFTAQGSGAGPLSYQWRFRGEPIVGATRPTLTITQATAARMGTYDCIISGAVPPTRAITRSATLQVGTTGVVCPADFNNQNGITVQDIYDFLAAWNAGCQ